MAKVITDGITSIGASMIPGRKRVALIIQEGNNIDIYGYFICKDGADEFMERLGNLCSAKKEVDSDA